MGVRQADLARVWGLNPCTISNLVKKGMPLDSEESAMLWRLRNRRGAKLGGKLPMDVAPKPPAISLPDQPSLPGMEANGTTEGALDAIWGRCVAAERRAHQAMEQTLVANSTTADQFKSYLAAHERSVLALLRVERQIKDEAINSRTLIPYDEALRQFMGVIGPLRTLIDSLPRVCGPRCNPSDPQLATQILQEWVENSFLKVLTHGENSVINSELAGPDAGGESVA